MNEISLVSQHRLLLVDDDDIFRDVLARALERRGYQVQVAGDAATALELTDKHHPRYAVVDLRLEGPSGLQLIPLLVVQEPGIRILMLTGYASIATAVEAIKLGATHYLAKPADVEEIITALTKVEGDAEAPIIGAPLSVDRLEWEHIQKVLAQHQGNISSTARALKMHRRTLQRKLAKRPVRG